MLARLYIAEIPHREPGKVFPPQRQAQLDATGNLPHRQQRYFVWKLLEYSIFDSLGLSLEQLRLTLHGSGRWSCEECFFSLAHSGQAVAVAISDAPIGVDLERLDRRVNPSLSRKILSPRQQEAFSLLDSSRQSGYLLETWCIRESLFKWREAASKDQPEPPSLTGTVTVAGQDYCYGVVSDHSECLQIFTDISL